MRSPLLSRSVVIIAHTLQHDERVTITEAAGYPQNKRLLQVASCTKAMPQCPHSFILRRNRKTCKIRAKQKDRGSFFLHLPAHSPRYNSLL